MRILVLTNHQLGLIKFRKELIEEMASKHNKIYVSVPEDGFTDEIEGFGCKVILNKKIDCRGINPLYDATLILYYRKLLKKIRPDIVLTYTIKPNVYGGMVCASFNIPYIANVTGLGTAVENQGVLSIIATWLYRIGLRKAHTVFFQNTHNINYMVSKGIVKGNYKLLPGSGVNLIQYKVLPYPQGETVDFVFIARIMKEKGIDQYLETAKVITKRHKGTRFHVCGYCENKYQLEIERMDKEGVIIFHGLVDDMTEIYRLASCVVHPTYYPEGLSNVLLEAAASGRPIITTNRPGCREVVDDAINGFVVKEKDSKNLIDKIEEFLHLSWVERKEMGLEGRKKIEANFDRRIVIEKYLEEIRSGI